MTNLGRSMVRDSTWIGSLRNWSYLTATSIWPSSSMSGAEKPGGDAMRSPFKSSFPPSSERCALRSVVRSLSDLVASVWMVRFRMPSKPKTVIPPASSRSEQRTRMARRKGLMSSPMAVCPCTSDAAHLARVNSAVQFVSHDRPSGEKACSQRAESGPSLVEVVDVAGSLRRVGDRFRVANEGARRGLEPEYLSGRLESPRELGSHVLPGA